MKKFVFNVLTFIAVIAGMLIFTGCPKDEPNTLSVSPTNITFTAVDPQEQLVTITTDADSWSHQVSAGWVSATPDQAAKTLKINAQAYTNTSDPRTAVLTITAGDAPPVTISITQSAKVQDNLSLSPTSLTFGASETGAKSVVVTTNAPSWDATPSASWVTVSKSGNNASVRVSSNTGTAERSATVTVKAGDAESKTFTVTQSGGNTLSVDKTSLNFAAASTTAQTITITTNASEWSVSRPSAVNTWLSVTLNGKVASIRPLSQNTSTEPRTATLTFEAGNATPVDVQVTQAGRTPPTPSVKPPQVRFRKQSNSDNTHYMAVFTTGGTVLATYQFDAKTGTSQYFTITPGNHYTMVIRYSDAAIIGWNNDDLTFNFQNNYLYTFEYTGSGYRMSWELNNSAPEKELSQLKMSEEAIKGTPIIRNDLKRWFEIK